MLRRNGKKPSAISLVQVAAADLDRAQIPRHVAIIMDGNGRWAKRRGFPRAAGHRAGIESLRRTVEAACDFGIGAVTVFAFSTENWERPREEVDFLLRLLREFLIREAKRLCENGVQVRVIGSRTGLSTDLLGEVDRVVALTRQNQRLILNIAFNYGGRAEIVEAARRIAEAARQGRLEPSALDEETFADYLSLPDVPDPDLIIRTGGDYRVSNFLLWQMAYSELWVTPTFWPEFNREHFLAALHAYQQRERRFGRLF